MSVLRTLTAIVEEQTFAKAAGAVHRTQAAVSQQMRKLEEQLGVQLFQRAGRNNEFTPEGLRVADYAKRMLMLHEEMTLSLRDEENQAPIRIGAPADLADSVLPSILRRCSQILGPAPMEIHVGRSPFLLTALREGAIDLTISTRWDQMLKSVLLRTSPVVWISSDAYKLD
ncbi:MAG: LysR family transcriptional regulator [Parvibaculaceae bacterium]